jgi:hypothetical protein
MLRFILSLGICFILLGCGKSSTSPEAKSEESKKEEEIAFDTPEEKHSAQWGDRFIALWMKEDYVQLYQLCGTHIQQTSTLDQFTEQWKAEREKYGKAFRADRMRGVTGEKEILAGPNATVPNEDQLDKVGRVLVSADAVGDIPDSIPVDIRKASVRCEIHVDPKTIPQMEGDPKIDPNEEAYYFLTLVTVEEQGQVRAGHFWLRWPGMLD